MLVTIYHAENNNENYIITEQMKNHLAHNEDISYDGEKWLYHDLEYIKNHCLFTGDSERTIEVFLEGNDGGVFVSQKDDGIIEYKEHMEDWEYPEKHIDSLINYIGGSYRHEHILDWVDEDQQKPLLDNWQK